MVDKTSRPTSTNKKILENPWVGSLVVPIAIVLVGALIVFGVTSMLSTDRSYKDLVREMQSKTFGNRWVAAYELSKVIATSSVPEEDMPWLVQNLGDVYDKSNDARTREFVIVAFSSLSDPIAIPWLYKGLDDEAPNVRFHALVGLGNMKEGSLSQWEPLYELLDDSDHALRHAAVFALATHEAPKAQEKIVPLLNDDVAGVRYASATSLIKYKDERAIKLLDEVLLMEEPDSTTPASREELFNSQDVANLKINVMNSLMREKWDALNQTLEQVVQQDKNNQVVTKAQEVLNLLKN